MQDSGMMLLQRVAERILARYLESNGRQGVEVVSNFSSLGGRGIDLTYAWQGSRMRIKVKPDPYFGIDAAKVGARAFSFYRAETGSYAFEAVANAATREPGWMFESDADEIYYYFVAIAQEEDEVRALVSEPDEVFFSELKVERDDLRILSMDPTRAWFEANYERYTPRPVMVGGASAWYRLVPRADIERSVAVKAVGPVFAQLARA